MNSSFEIVPSLSVSMFFIDIIRWPHFISSRAKPGKLEDISNPLIATRSSFFISVPFKLLQCEGMLFINDPLIYSHK